MKRSRLTLESVPGLATFATAPLDHEYEAYLFGSDVEAVPFPHWTAHLREFWGWYAEAPDYTTSAEHLPTVKAMIAEGLVQQRLEDLAEEVTQAKSGEELNCCLVRQYTREGRLYREINEVLRRGHVGEDLRQHGFTPWVLQFNSAIRQRPIFEGVSYRGARLTPADIDKYQPGLMFEWGGFISASKHRDVAVDIAGNVLFEITPWGSYSMYGKRNPIDIAELSIAPDEAEVIFPIACTFRVKGTRKEGHRSVIEMETVDQY